MTQDMVLDIFQEMLGLVIEMAGPLLLVSIAIGLVIAILQAATQIHEQTLTFVPKLAAIAFILLLAAPWMSNAAKDFVGHIFDIIDQITRP